MAFNVNSLVQNNQPQGGVFSGPGFTGGNQSGMSPAGDVPGNTVMQNPNGTAFDADQNGNPTGPYVNPSAGASGYNNAFGTSAWNPQYQQNLGSYNPAQYATTGTANDLAQMLGGRVQQTRYDQASPFGIPPQNMINFGGADSLNAGLLADRYAKYDRATADAMTRAELAMMGPGQNPNADSQGGSLGSWSQYTEAPGGNNYLGQGANMGQYLGAGGVPQGGGGVGNNAPAAPQQYGNQIYNTGQTPQQLMNPLNQGTGQGMNNAYGSQAANLMNFLRGGSMQFQNPAPRFGGFGQFRNFNAANSFRNRPPAFNQGLMGQLMGMPSLLSRLNQVSGFGGQGGPFGMGGQYGSFGGGMNPYAAYRQAEINSFNQGGSQLYPNWNMNPNLSGLGFGGY